MIVLALAYPQTIRKPVETPGAGFFYKHHASVGNGSERVDMTQQRC